ncbi:MAG: PKD domain-containing protein [Candidatus Diapherotrites archaeon]
MKKALFVFAVILLLACAYAEKKVQLLVEDDGVEPVTAAEDADIQANAYTVHGPGPYTLTVKIKNLQAIEETGGPVDVMLIMDASYSFNEELDVVEQNIEALGAEMAQKCQEMSLPGCFRLGVYVFEGGGCTQNCGTEEVCTRSHCAWVTVEGPPSYTCHYEPVQTTCEVCTGSHPHCTPSCHWHDNVRECDQTCENVEDCHDEPCTDREWVCEETPGRPVREYECECVESTMQNVCYGTTCKAPDATFWSPTGSSNFIRPATNPKPMDWQNDVGLLPITGNMTLVKNNLAKVDAYDPVTQQIEPWGDIIRYIIGAPEAGWGAGRRKSIILITDEKDESNTYQAVAQAAKDQGIPIFGIIGTGAGSSEAMGQAQYVANKTGGQVYSYNNSSGITSALRAILGVLVSQDTLMFSRELGPNWDGITGNVELPPLPRNGEPGVYTINGVAPEIWPNTEEYFQYRVSLKNDPGIYDDAWVRVVMNDEPQVDFDMIPTPPNGQVPLSVKFVNRTTDQHVLGYSWNFGDPGSGTQNTSLDTDPTHLYDSEEEYTVRLTATDTFGATGWKEKTVSARQIPAITGFKVRAPLTPETEADITVSCTKTDFPLKIEFFDNKGNLITKDANGNTIDNPIKSLGNMPTCTGSIISGPKLPTGVYLVKATILKNDLSGPDPECTNCPKTTNIVVGEKMQEVQTPEMPAIMAMGIALAVMLVVNRKK